MYGDSSSLLLPAVLEGFLANAVPCCECGLIPGQGGGSEGRVGARDGLPPPQQIPWPAACSWPFAREQPKSGRCELFWQRDPPLAGWYPKGSLSRWELTPVPALCAASKAPVVYVLSKSDAYSTSPRVGLVGWAGRVSCVASPITGVRFCSLPVEDWMEVRISWGLLFWFSILDWMVSARCPFKVFNTLYFCNVCHEKIFKDFADLHSSSYKSCQAGGSMTVLP